MKIVFCHNTFFQTVNPSCCWVQTFVNGTGTTLPHFGKYNKRNRPIITDRIDSNNSQRDNIFLSPAHWQSKWSPSLLYTSATFPLVLIIPLILFLSCVLSSLIVYECLRVLFGGWDCGSISCVSVMRRGPRRWSWWRRGRRGGSGHCRRFWERGRWVLVTTTMTWLCNGGGLYIVIFDRKWHP